jgi:general secretion pathway protein A
MFLDYYGLREQPFGVTPDLRYLYFSPSHREALASLYYGLETGRGFLLLVAQPGMGKTTLMLQLLEQLRGSAQTVFLFQTQCTSRELLRYLLVDLGVETPAEGLVEMHEQLKEALLETFRQGKRLVVIIDEAQGLEDGALELVRLLSNFETSHSKLMQIVLAGQPTLASRLGHYTLDPLRQRVSIIARLEPFGLAATTEYVNHRLRVAGYEGGSLFTQDALALLAKESHGIPRIINNFCFNALSLSYAEQKQVVDASIMQRVAADLDLDGPRLASGATLPALELSGAPSGDEKTVTATLPAPVAVEVIAPYQPAERSAGGKSFGMAGLRTRLLRLVPMGLLILSATFFAFTLLERRGFSKLTLTEIISTKTTTDSRWLNEVGERTLNRVVQELGVEVRNLLPPQSKVRKSGDGRVLSERQTSVSGAGSISAGAREEEKL